MSETSERSPSELDLWLARHSTLVLLIGLALGMLGVVVGGMTRTSGGGGGGWAWALFVPAFLLVGLAARAKSMAKRSRT